MPWKSVSFKLETYWWTAVSLITDGPSQVAKFGHRTRKHDRAALVGAQDRDSGGGQGGCRSPVSTGRSSDLGTMGTIGTIGTTGTTGTIPPSVVSPICYPCSWLFPFCPCNLLRFPRPCPWAFLKGLKPVNHAPRLRGSGPPGAR